MKYFALVDCNNFFVSCERMFQPHLEDRAVVVLSNNDGCVIARSNEAKNLHIPMGAPYYQYRELFDRYNVSLFSSNFALYADISHRIMSILEELCPDIEIYSIDEAFLDFSKIKSPLIFAKQIQQTIKKWIGIPVSIGIATTKTLAKLANKIAKQSDGIFSLDETCCDQWLQKFSTDAVWGVGNRLAKKLTSKRIFTAYNLKMSKEGLNEKNFSIPLQKTIYELNGIPCFTIENSPSSRKSLVVSKSFQKPLTQLQDIQEALCHYTLIAFEKLRSRHQMAKYITVFLHTNLHSHQMQKYFQQCSIALPYYIDCSTTALKAAMRALEKIYKKELPFVKVGIQLCDLVERNDAAQDLFDTRDRQKMRRFSTTFDAINQKYGKNTLQPARALGEKKWCSCAQFQSPKYTTSFSELLKVKA